MKNKLFSLLLCAPLLVGCADQEQTAKKKIDSTCQSLIGCTEEDVILELGAPQSVQEAGGLKIYKFHKSYGSRSNRDIYTSQSGLFGSGTEYRWEACDIIEVFFKDGIAISWKSSVKR